MKRTEPKNIDEYIAGFPQDVQKRPHKLRAIVREGAPDAEEALKYRMPTFVLQENLVHFAAFENHVGFYPTPSAICALCRQQAGLGFCFSLPRVASASSPVGCRA